MEALAFICPRKPSSIAALAGSFQHTVEHLHPSEDGEALQREALNSGVEPRWFAVYTTCRHEKRVAQHLAQREIEHYLPLYRSARKWRDGSKVTLELPLFPCYLFVRIPRSGRVNVLSVPGALTVVGGTGKEPAPLAESAIEALRTGLREHKIEPHQLLRVGEMARIRSGAFAGMKGVVLRRKGGCRIVLTLEQIMQSVAVEVDEEDLESVPRVESSVQHLRRAAGRFQLQEAF
jgi:transcription antitermination factor NusG